MSSTDGKKPHYRTVELYAAELDRNVTLRIFSRVSRGKTAPLVLMQDGQNLFDDRSASYGRSWRLLPILQQGSFPEITVVGIDCVAGIGRLDEYCPYVCDPRVIGHDGVDRSCGGKGGLYLKWVVDRLLPWIRGHYPVNERIVMGGSSMGGYISLAAALEYPERFYGIFGMSNAFWFATTPLCAAIAGFTGTLPKLWLDAGDAECADPVLRAWYLQAEGEVETALRAKPHTALTCRIIPGAIHHESAWEARIEEILRALLQ